MRRILATALLAPLVVAGAVSTEPTHRVEVTPHAVAPRVDVTVDGKPFTSYVFERAQKKPFLYPLRTARGTVVTRGYPVDPRPNERTDHPHHIGLWFNYGNVNGLDFWNNSDAIPPARAAKMGTVVHKRVIEASSGKDKGQLDVEMDWVDSNGTVLLKEVTRFVFQGDAASRTIDRITRLSAVKEPVVMGESKEGVLGIRVARSLEQPSKQADVFTDASGKPAGEKRASTEGVTGNYIGSDGKTGDAVWGTRGPWTMLTGKVDSEQVTLAILDHPRNPGFPTYWHARGYGLFAANNLGQHEFDPQQPERQLTIKPGDSVTLRHRVLIVSGTADAARMNAEHKKFAAEK
jgi:Methane oxygenase PmoA